MKLRVPFAVETREDLHEMQQVVSNGHIYYRAPRTEAGHSDRCTALALARRAAATGGSTWTFTPEAVESTGTGNGERGTMGAMLGMRDDFTSRRLD